MLVLLLLRVVSEALVLPLGLPRRAVRSSSKGPLSSVSNTASASPTPPSLRPSRSPRYKPPLMPARERNQTDSPKGKKPASTSNKGPQARPQKSAGASKAAPVPARERARGETRAAHREALEGPQPRSARRDAKPEARPDMRRATPRPAPVQAAPEREPEVDGPVVLPISKHYALEKMNAEKAATKAASKAAAKGPKRPKPTDIRSGRVGIVGRPNVGKSTLMNALLGQKLAIMTSKPGTTRTVLLGVYDQVDDENRRTQVAFLDTPGLELGRTVLGRIIVEEAQSALETVDAFIMLVEAESVVRSGELIVSDQRVLTMLKEVNKPIILAISKVDLVKEKARLLPALEKLQSKYQFTAMVPVSSTRKIGLDALVSEVRGHLSTELLFESDALTDRPERFFVSELLREAIMDMTRDEVPYSVAVQIDEWVEEGNLVRVGVMIIVEKDSQKGILIGARGSMLKEIGERARHGMEEFLGRKVFLRTFVKVVEGWTKDAEKVRRLVREGQLP